MKELNTLRTFLKWINEAPYFTTHNDLNYAVERVEEMVRGLFMFAEFKIGDRVVLNKTPVINKNVAWGWMGCKHFLIEGAQATVCDVDWYNGSFRYGVKFEEKPTSVFTFYEYDLEISQWETVNA